MLKLLSNKKKYCVFDIGSDKVICLFFKIENKKPKIIGMDHQKSDGYYFNNYINEEKLSKTILKAFSQSIPKNSNIKDFEYFSNITDINSLVKKSYTELSTGKLGITKKDIRRLFNKSVIDARIKGKNLIHSYPIYFRLNESKIVDDPLGEKCKKFGISSLNVFINNKITEILHKCFRNQKIEIKNFFDSGIASMIANATDLEKKNGVACIDIGSTTSKVTVYIKDKIVFSKVFAIGGYHVTSDISKGLDISKESAEHTKIINGSLKTSFNEKIEINSIKSKSKVINKNLLYGIIKPRYEEIFEIIRDSIFDDMFARVTIKSIILTGGASKIYGISDLSENILNRKVRIGSVNKKNSFFYNKPEFSTLLGLIKLTQEKNRLDYSSKFLKGNFLSAFDKLENWIEESYA